MRRVKTEKAFRRASGRDDNKKRRKMGKRRQKAGGSVCEAMEEQAGAAETTEQIAEAAKAAEATNAARSGVGMWSEIEEERNTRKCGFSSVGRASD